MDMREHLRSRYFNVNLHPAYTNDEENTATFPLYDLSGRMIGYQRYNPTQPKIQKNHETEGRYFTWRTKDEKKSRLGFWGLESWNFSDTLFVTEGIFDAARLTWHGRSAIAILTNDASPSAKEQFYILRQRRYLVAVEDASKSKLAKLCHSSYKIATGNDVGDCSEEEIGYILNAY